MLLILMKNPKATDPKKAWKQAIGIKTKPKPKRQDESQDGVKIYWMMIFVS